MDARKQKEIEYYDKKAEKWLKDNPDKTHEGDFEGFNPGILSSFSFCYQRLERKCKNKKVLDYGCGNGIHSVKIAKMEAKVVGIDLSESSLLVARERAKKEGARDKIEFLKMDCEKMDFPENSFDIIFDGGTFSSLDIKKVYSELVWVLKPDGILIGIETLGHNPFTNLKRKINKLTGKRTGWATGHIFKTQDLEEAKKYFEKIEVDYFHLVSYLTFPFLKFSFGKYLLKFFEAIDRILAKLPFLRKYAFKVVFVFSEPRKTRT